VMTGKTHREDIFSDPGLKQKNVPPKLAGHC
jgi:hypothetical protein